MKETRIIIADDHQLFADGLLTILQEQPGLRITDTVRDGHALLRSLRTSKAELVLLDLSMPGMNGLDAAKHLRSEFPDTAILVITMNDSTEILVSLMDLGVQGIVFKNTGKAELLQAIATILSGNRHFSQEVTLQLARGFGQKPEDPWQLTKRERDVLKLIQQGLTTNQIAEKLFISPHTVETHRKNLHLKSGLNKSLPLISEAIRLGYLKSGEGL